MCPSGQRGRMEKCPTQWKIMLSVVSPRVCRFGQEEAADLEKRDEWTVRSRKQICVVFWMILVMLV